MSEPRAMREIHEIRERMYEETKDLSPEEYEIYSMRKMKEQEDYLRKIGYKWIPCEDMPGATRLIRISDLRPEGDSE